MVQGTGSGVGKSLLVTALCRLFARAGYRVASFKSQNMSLNAAVTPEGGEIGRARAAQAGAAGIEPTVDMNPILLKPEADDRSQVVVRGVAEGRFAYREYAGMRSRLVEVVLEILERLRAGFDLVVIEGRREPGRDQPGGHRAGQHERGPNGRRPGAAGTATSTAAVSSRRSWERSTSRPWRSWSGSRGSMTAASR
jgi:hypothetical protein